MSTDQSKTVRTYDDLDVGDSYRATRFISEQDVLAFAEITGDDNPIHTDEEYAAPIAIWTSDRARCDVARDRFQSPRTRLSRTR